MATQDEYIKTALRLPRDLHSKVQESAEVKGRSMNSEIIALLEKALNTQNTIPPGLEAFVGMMSGDGNKLGNIIRQIEINTKKTDELNAQVRETIKLLERNVNANKSKPK